MLFLGIIISIIWIGLGVFIGKKNLNWDIVSSTINSTNVWSGNVYQWTWIQVDTPHISYQDKKWTQIFTNEDDFLDWFVSSWKSYNDIGKSIQIAGLNLTYILLADFLQSTNNWTFESFFNRNGVIPLMVLLNKERSIKNIEVLVPQVFEIFYNLKGDEFIASQNKVIGTTGLWKNELKLRCIDYAKERMKKLTMSWFLETDFAKIGFYNPVEIGVQNLPIDKLKELCAQGVANKEYPMSYCMDFVYFYRSTKNNPYLNEIKNIFIKSLAEWYNLYGINKSWK